MAGLGNGTRQLEKYSDGPDPDNTIGSAPETVNGVEFKHPARAMVIDMDYMAIDGRPDFMRVKNIKLMLISLYLLLICRFCCKILPWRPQEADITVGSDLYIIGFLCRAISHGEGARHNIPAERINFGNCAVDTANYYSIPFSTAAQWHVVKILARSRNIIKTIASHTIVENTVFSLET